MTKTRNFNADLAQVGDHVVYQPLGTEHKATIVAVFDAAKDVSGRIEFGVEFEFRGKVYRDRTASQYLTFASPDHRMAHDGIGRCVDPDFFYCPQERH